MGMLEERAGLVTGGGSGIGRASALAFAAEGGQVMVVDVNDDGGHETVKLIEASGGTAAFTHCDVTDEDQVGSMVAETVKRFGRLDWAHNNVGIPPPQTVRVDQQERDWWTLVLQVDLVAVMLCMKYEIRQFLSQGNGGAIVNTSSLAGLTGQPTLSAYCAAKWGVNGLTKTAALEYAGDGIRVNSICPGTTETEGFKDWKAQAPDLAAKVEAGIPMGRVASPDEQAQAAMWLCSSRASYVTGALFPVTGGCDW